jgi:hypothetical protein
LLFPFPGAVHHPLYTPCPSNVPETQNKKKQPTTKGCGDLYFAFNAHGFEVPAQLPPPPPGRKWARVVDTNLPSPRDFTPGGNAGIEGAAYGVAPHSAIMLVAKPAAA